VAHVREHYASIDVSCVPDRRPGEVLLDIQLLRGERYRSFTLRRYTGLSEAWDRQQHQRQASEAERHGKTATIESHGELVLGCYEFLVCFERAFRTFSISWR